MINCMPQKRERERKQEVEEQAKPYRNVMLSSSVSLHYDYAEDLLVLYSLETKQQTRLTWEEMRNLAEWTMEQDT